MSELNVDFDFQRSPSIIRRDLIKKARRKVYQLSETMSVVSLRMDWPYRFEPFAVMDSLRCEWKIYWRSKQNQTAHLQKVAFGSCVTLKSLDELNLQVSSDLPWFVSLPFNDDADGESWQELGLQHIFLPRAEWTVDDRTQKTCLELRISIEATAEKTERMDLSDRFESLLLEYLPLSLHRSQGKHSLASVGSTMEQVALDDWRQSVESAKQKIAQADFHKVVLSRSKKLELSEDVEVGALLSALSSIDEQSYLFALVHPSGRQAFIGRSPESLLVWDERHYYLDAIAGTRRRSENRADDFGQASDLRSSRKDLVEHRHVTSFVEELLNEFSLDCQKIESESLLRLANVQHLRSRYQSIRDLGKSSLDFLVRIHPTPAVCGLPQDVARQFIRENETHERGLFAGTIGWVSQQSGDFAIGIRSAFKNGKSLTLFAGSGIVFESDADLEWQETELKMKNFLDLFSLSSESEH